MNKILRAIRNPGMAIRIVLGKILDSKLCARMSDELYLKIFYRLALKKSLNLENPKTYNEKLQWLKLHDRKPEYTQMVDKCDAKKYVAERIGEEYIIPTYGVWNSFDEIDFDTLPDSFVLKCTHDCGGMVICKDKSKLDITAAKKKIKKALKRNYYSHGREWPYKNVKPRIIAEKYMEDSATAELRDYKFFCFGGEPKILFIVSQRQSENDETKFDYFDMDFNHLSLTNGHPNASVLPSKPQNFELMRELAEKLSAGIPQLRVDFYEVDGKVYFGELTFFNRSGVVTFYPEEWNYTLGEWIKLPDYNK